MSVFLEKPQPSDDDFTQAVEQWLTGEVTGHLGAYMYTNDSDDQRWKQGHSAPTYYLGADDKASFDLVIRDFEMNVANLIDLGPGGEASVIAKSLPLLQAVKPSCYLPVDLSATLAKGAATVAETHCKTSGRPIIADFFKPMSLRVADSLLAFMGGTLANMETYENKRLLQKRLTEIFDNFADVICRQGYMLVSFDANTNTKEIVDCYVNPQIEGLVRSCIDRAIDTRGFDYGVVWTEANYQLATGLRAKHDQVVKFNGGQYSIEEGEFLPVLNSYRFPTHFVQEAATQAGWQHQRTWSASGRTHYLLFNYAP